MLLRHHGHYHWEIILLALGATLKLLEHLFNPKERIVGVLGNSFWLWDRNSLERVLLLIQRWYAPSGLIPKQMIKLVLRPWFLIDVLYNRLPPTLSTHHDISSVNHFWAIIFTTHFSVPLEQHVVGCSTDSFWVSSTRKAAIIYVDDSAFRELLTNNLVLLVVRVNVSTAWINWIVSTLNHYSLW